uniref:Uncharacterized protein n=1 Tax=Kalanchoe fedtschenkoi TaxID=63787 RepID=A0A7N0TJ15_KALFE
MMAEHENDQAPAPSRKLHIAMFPWLAFGHMMPFLHLAKLIAQKGHQLSFLSTPLNIDRLLTSLVSSSDDAISMIHFVKLQFHRHPSLPEKAEATADVTYKQVHYLFESFDWLQDEITLFLKTSKPDWIIQDFASHWLGPIAHQLGTRCAFFSVYKATSMIHVSPPKELCGFGDYRTKPEDYTTPPKWIPFPSNLTMHLYEVLRIMDNMEPDNTGLSPYDRAGGVVLNSDTILIRSCYELESRWLNLLQTLYRKPVLPIGLLPAVIDPAKKDRDTTWEPIKTWLDRQNKSSVVYVAFGSETKPSQSELTELALGLEMSKLPFFWALKTRRGLADDEPIKLPEGFVNRVGERGMVSTSWVPQLKVLSHGSVGGVLFHSGWSTVIEAVQFGKSMVVVPLQSDQPLVARFMEADQLGYCLPRDEKDGRFTKEAVAAGVRLVMVEEEGRVYREKVMEMKDLFADLNMQDRYVESMLEHMVLG